MKAAQYFLGGFVFIIGIAGALAAFTALTELRDFVVWLPVSLLIALAGVVAMREAGK